MSSKFNQGRPTRFPPPVCFPPRPSPPIEPWPLPQTLLAQFFLKLQTDEVPNFLDLQTCTLVKDPENTIWSYLRDTEDDGFGITLQYDEPTDLINVEYYRSIPVAPEHFETWYDRRPENRNPFALTLEPIVTFPLTTTSWGSITA